MNLEESRRPFRHGLGVALGDEFDDANDVTVLRNGDRIFPAMLNAIERAEKSIDFLTFVYWRGDIAERFAKTLGRRARDGIRVRVLLDAFGAQAMPGELVKRMHESGVEFRWFRPLSLWRFRRNNRRTHRKILVCDARVAFTGGVGIASEWEGDARNSDEWRETHFEIRGAAVNTLRSSFLTNWLEAGGALTEEDLIGEEARPEGSVSLQVVSKPGVWGRSNVTTSFQASLMLARSRVRITTPYFVPGDVMVRELVSASRRGVQVDILMPGKFTDTRIGQQAGEARYAELFEVGVRIWRYQRSMLHAKIITVDRELACVGSANFNQRSMQRDEEVVINILHRDTVAELDEHFEQDVDLAQRYTLEQWRKRGRWQRFKESCSSALRNNL